MEEREVVAASEQPDWRRWAEWGVGLLIVSVVVATALYAWIGRAEPLTATRAAPSTTAAVAATLPATTSTLPPTTVDPDATCTSAFATAIASGLDSSRISTVGACTEEQWMRVQAATPMVGVTLADLCVARGGFPATACGTADAERLVAEQAAAAEDARAAEEAARVAAAERASETLPPAAPPPTSEASDTPATAVLRETHDRNRATSTFDVTGNWTVRWRWSGSSSVRSWPPTVECSFMAKVVNADRSETTFAPIIDGGGKSGSGEIAYVGTGTFRIEATLLCQPVYTPGYGTVAPEPSWRVLIID